MEVWIINKLERESCFYTLARTSILLILCWLFCWEYTKCDILSLCVVKGDLQKHIQWSIQTLYSTLGKAPVLPKINCTGIMRLQLYHDKLMITHSFWALFHYLPLQTVDKQRNSCGHRELFALWRLHGNVEIRLESVSYKITAQSRVLLEKLIVTQLVKKFLPSFVKPEGSLPCSKGPATDP